MPTPVESLQFCSAIAERFANGEINAKTANDQIVQGMVDGHTDAKTASAIARRRIGPIPSDKPKREKRRKDKKSKGKLKRTDKNLHINGYTSRNNLLRSLGFESYSDYLKTDLWKSIRNQILRDNPQCFKCGQQATEVHHSIYSRKNIQGRSHHGLHPICRECHESAEFDQNGNKLNLSAANRRLGLEKARSPRRKKRKKKRRAWARKRRRKTART